VYGGAGEKVCQHWAMTGAAFLSPPLWRLQWESCMGSQLAILNVEGVKRFPWPSSPSMQPAVHIGTPLISHSSRELVLGLGGDLPGKSLCMHCLFFSRSPGGWVSCSQPLPARWHLSNTEFYTTFHSLTLTHQHVTYTTIHVTSDSGP